MERRFIELVLKGLLIYILISACLSTFELQVKADSPYQYVPDSSMVPLSHYRINGNSYVMAYIELPSSTCYVDYWGSIYTSLNYIFVSAQIWRSSPELPIVIPVSHVYDLGALPLGTYTFIFMVWSLGEEDNFYCLSKPDSSR